MNKSLLKLSCIALVCFGHLANARIVDPTLHQQFIAHRSSQQIKLFVSVAGNDQGKGTMNSPYRSLTKALSVAQQLKRKDVSILIRKGIYYLDKTLVLEAKNILCASLKMESYPGEKVVISAGRRLMLKWKPFKNGIYIADVPSDIEFERLYLNGTLQQMARYPNYDHTSRIFNGTAADVISTERVSRWKNPAGGYIHGLHEYEWGSFDYSIKGKDKNDNLLMEGGWQNNRPAQMHHQFRYVENIKEELDCSGEWFLDKVAHTLLYYPAKDVNLATAAIEVSHLKNSIELRGTADLPVSRIELKGLSFEHNERTFMETKEPLLRSDWTIYRGGAVLFDGTRNCKITDCSFTGLGGNAIMLSNYNVKDTITGTYVAHIGASAVCFVGNTTAVRSPLFNYQSSLTFDKIDKIPGARTNDYPQECVVDNNLFHHLGEIEKQATGVQIAISSEIKVTRNSIYNTPRAGINIGDGCFGGHIIAYNDVFNTVMETGDHGAFNAWGRDRYWNPNRQYMDSLVKVHPELILLDARKQVIIHDNRFRCDHGWDIDLDDGASNYHIYNNICLSGGLKLREGFYRIVENNIMVNNSFHPHVWFANSGDVFEHNIVTTGYFPIDVNDWGKRVDYNLFIKPEGLTQANGAGTDRHSITGDPLFINASKGDYTVAPNSPAFKIGFRNIVMNNFGVQKPALKKIALRPAITPIEQVKTERLSSPAVSFLGGELRNVNGIGDRSSYGLPDEKGIIVISVSKNSLLAKSGIVAKDVIRSAGGKAIDNMQDLIEVCRLQNQKSSIAAEIIRNQRIFKIRLRIQ